ncbi:hypothetical protein [Aureimonas ureilytica]|uniref:hypothetical protein n=1 Tax=Aureimonas ureilytica TaxID=401562 RepID=UPI00035E5E2A|nr:hypothetical protein [Aureimonas ureilytica]
MGRIVKTAKAKVSIGVVADDEPTLAKYKADTAYILIDGLTNIGAYGASRQLITSDHVNSGVTKKAKGSTNYGSMNIAADYQPNDPGQIAVEAAVESDDRFNIKVERPIGKGKWRVDYFPAYVMSNSNELGGSNDAQKLQITLELDDKPVTEMPA